MLVTLASSYYNSSSGCAFVCSPAPPRSFDGSSPNLVCVCRWTSELSLRGSFLKSSTGQQVNGSNVTFSEQTTPGWDHTAAKGVPSKRHTTSKSLIPSTGIFTSSSKRRQSSVGIVRNRFYIVQCNGCFCCCCPFFFKGLFRKWAA